MKQTFVSWSTATLSVLAIILVLSCRNSETFDFTKCDITDNFRSELVSASFKTLEAGLGCETNATSSSGQEVHVIMVNPPVLDNDRWYTVKLSIHSRRHANFEEKADVNFQEEPMPVVFVLHSSMPVRWIVEMFGLDSQQKHLFMLSKESSIQFQRKRTRLMAKTRKRQLLFSADNSTVYQWTQKRFGAVTSYSIISQLNVKFYIGRDVSADMVCDLNALSSSLRIFSYHETVKPITGCVSKRRNRHVRAKPVYIIELVEPPNPSPGIIGVDLEILPYNSGMNMRSRGQSSDYDTDQDWHFYLVVKSPPSLRWTLHSRKVSGWVDIVADASADVKVTGVKISTVALRADDIKVTGKQLVEWSQDYIAPVQMYAGIHAANTIKLKVPPLEKNMASTRDPDTSNNHNSGQEPKMPREGGCGRDHEYVTVGSHDSTSEFIHVTCTDQDMLVTISQKLFQMFGLDKTKVSLMDPSCRPTAEIEDHIILCAGLSHCGAQSEASGDMTLFTNAVVIQTPPNLVSSLLANEMGSGFHDDDASSGSPDLSLGIDDEDFRPSQISIPVECKLLVTNETSKNSSDLHHHTCGQQEPQLGIKCSIGIYSAASFLQPEVQFPATLAKNSTVYVKAVVDQDTSLVLEACWFSTSSQPNDQGAQVKVIASHGCITDDALSWLDDPLEIPEGTNLQNMKLQLRVTDVFKGLSPLYVHCQLRTCQRRQGSMHTQKCSTGVRCRQHTPQAVHSMPQGPLPNSYCGPLTIGPLELTDKEALVKKTITGGSQSSNSQEIFNPSQEQKIIVEGLDSATVVGIAFAAFVIGILVMGTLWFIHSHTGPIKRAVASQRDPETSVNVTPTPSSPMTA